MTYCQRLCRPCAYANEVCSYNTHNSLMHTFCLSAGLYENVVSLPIMNHRSPRTRMGRSSGEVYMS